MIKTDINSINNNKKSLGDIVLDLDKRNNEVYLKLAREKYKNQCLIAELKAINEEINKKLSNIRDARKSSKYSIYRDIKRLSRILNILLINNGVRL